MPTYRIRVWYDETYVVKDDTVQAAEDWVQDHSLKDIDLHGFFMQTDEIPDDLDQKIDNEEDADV